jgi:hypothetical protein
MNDSLIEYKLCIRSQKPKRSHRSADHMSEPFVSCQADRVRVNEGKLSFVGTAAGAHLLGPKPHDPQHGVVQYNSTAGWTGHSASGYTNTPQSAYMSGFSPPRKSASSSALLSTVESNMAGASSASPFGDTKRFMQPHYSAVLPGYANEEGDLIREAFRTGTCTPH